MIKQQESARHLLALCDEMDEAIDEVPNTVTPGDRLILTGRLRVIRSRIKAVVLEDMEQDSGSVEMAAALILAAAVPTILLLVFLSMIFGAVAGQR